MTTLRPLSAARRIRVVAPSSPYATDRLDAGVARLRGAGFEVEDTSSLLVGEHAYLNGTDDERRAALEAALSSDVDIVWVARGGYGLTRLLGRLELPEGPLPVVVGFSDCTALSGFLLRRGCRSVHGPLATSLAGEPDDSFAHLLRVLEGDLRGQSLDGLRVLAGESSVSGPLFAANLCVLGHMIGTSAMPDLRGHIVVLEEIGERPYRIDRMLTHLVESGAFDGVAGVVVGHLTGCTEPGEPARRVPSAEEVFTERLAPLGVPVVAGARVGHEAPNFALPVGARATLAIDSGDARLVLDEELRGEANP
jgi:muramoyltetrapeptide carboxypeptidase